MAHYGPLWPIVAPMLAPSFERGGDDVGDVIAQLETKHAQLWIAHEGESVFMAAITTASGSDVHVWHLAGREYQRWIAVATFGLIQAARERGFEKITIDGRKGWQRLLAGYGFKAAGDGLEAML